MSEVTERPDSKQNAASREARGGRGQMAKLNDLQTRVATWATIRFGRTHVLDPKVRAFRLLEEAIEFARAVGAPSQSCEALVEYVYERPAGHPHQELGGVGVTWLAALTAMGDHAEEVLTAEVERIESKLGIG
jgi:hypothetical protein